jgi:hypothetical protein
MPITLEIRVRKPRQIPVLVDRYFPSDEAPKIEIPVELSQYRNIRILRLADAMYIIRREPNIEYYCQRGAYHVYTTPVCIFHFYHDLISPLDVIHIVATRAPIARESNYPYP